MSEGVPTRMLFLRAPHAPSVVQTGWTRSGSRECRQPREAFPMGKEAERAGQVARGKKVTAAGYSSEHQKQYCSLVIWATSRPGGPVREADACFVPRR